MKAIVHTGCIACGLCVSICPNVFQIGEDGFSRVIQDVSLDCLDKAQEAAQNCPVQVIEINEK